MKSGLEKDCRMAVKLQFWNSSDVSRIQPKIGLDKTQIMRFQETPIRRRKKKKINEKVQKIIHS